MPKRTREEIEAHHERLMNDEQYLRDHVAAIKQKDEAERGDVWCRAWRADGYMHVIAHLCGKIDEALAEGDSRRVTVLVNAIRRRAALALEPIAPIEDERGPQ